MSNHELTLLSVCLLDNRYIDKAILTGLNSDWFTVDIYKTLWTGIVNAHNKGKVIDILWATDFLKEKTGKIHTFLSKGIGQVGSLTEFDTAIEIMRKQYNRRQVSNIITNAQRRLYADDPITITDTIINELSGVREAGTTQPQQNIEEEINKRLNRTTIIKTGIPKLTWMTKGVERGAMWVIGGYTSHGKSTVCLNIAHEVAKQGYRVTIFSTEMNEVLLTERLATMISGINPSIMVSLTQTEKEAYMSEVKKIKDLPIYMCRTSSFANIRINIQKQKSLLYIVDYIQMIYPDQHIDNDVKRLGYIVRELETMSKEYNCCIIATSQFHRQAQGKDGKRPPPELSSFRGSGEIEENTDIGVLLYYPYQMASFENKEKLKGRGEDNLLKMCVSKNRLHGLTGVINLNFDRRNMRISEVEKK